MNDPSFDHIDFGPGYIYQPYPALEGDVPVEEPNRPPIELRMTPPPELGEDMLRFRELNRQMVTEMLQEAARRTSELLTESLRQCAEAPEEPFVRRYLPVVAPPPGDILIAGIDC